jgi:hypothetical protein
MMFENLDTPLGRVETHNTRANREFIKNGMFLLTTIINNQLGMVSS